jgi:hypothetical protein
LNLLNESGGFVDCILIRGILCLCGGKRNYNINGSQGLESQTHLKWDMVEVTMESFVVTVLDIWETLVPCTKMLRFVHVHNVKNHLIGDLGLAIHLGVERSGFCELGVQRRPETRQNGAEEPTFSIGDDGLWYPKVHPNSFEEDLGSISRYENIDCCEDGHPRKSINNHKHAVISMLGGQKTKHVIHGYGLP